MKRYVRAAARDLNPRKPNKRSEAIQHEFDISEVVEALVQSAANAFDVDVNTTGIRYNQQDDFFFCHIDIDGAITHGGFPLTFRVDNVSSKDVQDIVNEFIDYIEEAHNTNELVFKDEANDYIESFRPAFNEIKKVTESVAREYDSDLVLDVDQILNEMKNKGIDHIFYCIGEPPYYVTHVSEAKVEEVDNLVQLSYRGVTINPEIVRERFDLRPISQTSLTSYRNGTKNWFDSCISLMDDADVVIDQSQSFENDVVNFCENFTAINISRYPGLSLSYDVDSPIERGEVIKSYYKNNRPSTQITVRCYNDQIAFQMEFTYDEWYKTDVDKKIINAIKYRKRRDGIK